MAYTVNGGLILGALNTGLTLVAALFDTTGTPAGGLATINIHEAAAGSGTYSYSLTVPDNHRGYVKFTSAGTFKSAIFINPDEVLNAYLLALIAAAVAPVVDAELSGTHGAGAWTESGGMGSGSNTVTITVQNVALAPVVGAMVTVKNFAETAVIAGPLPTNVSGQVVFNLDAATYKILVASTPTYLPLVAQTLVVTTTTAVTYTLTLVSTTTPSTPSLAVVSGFLTLLTGQPAVGIDIVFQLELHKGAEDGTLIITVGLPVIVTTDAAGYFSTELIRTDAMALHDPDDTAVYNVRVREGVIDEHFTLTAASVDLSAVLPGV